MTPKDQKPLRCAIYCRISSDRLGQAAGVKRQENDCRTLADSLGWEVVEVMVDNDRSAYSGKSRPGYEALLRLMETGAVDAVIAWAQDRLQRSPRELEHFIDLVESTRVKVQIVRQGEVDLSTATGRGIARVVGAMARMESDQKSERIKAQKEHAAAAGRWLGGVRPFGYAPGDNGCLEVVPEEAEMLRKAAQMVLAGDSLSTVVAALDASGVGTVKGGPWSIPSLVNALTSRTAAGETIHRGQVIATGHHEAILDASTSAQLRALFENRRSGPKPRVGLLGGLAVCGLCGFQLQSARNRKGVRIYRCAPKKVGGCNSLQAVAERVEEIVVADFQALTATERFASRLASKDGDAAAIAAAQEAEEAKARLSHLAEMYASGELSEGEWNAARSAVGKITSVASGVAALDPLDPAELGDAFDRLPLERRRRWLSAVFSEVVVLPSKQRGPVFDPDRVIVKGR